MPRSLFRSPYISWNIGHGDPFNGVQIKVLHIINYHQVRTICAFILWSATAKTPKSAKNDYLEPCFFQNIGHSDLHFGMQIKAFHTIINNQVRTKHGFNWCNLSPNTSKSAEITLYLMKYGSWWPNFWCANKGIPHHSLNGKTCHQIQKVLKLPYFFVTCISP